MAFEGIPYDIFDSFETEYRCTCSREKYQRALVSLGDADIEELQADGNPVETQCRFCAKKYSFDMEEIVRIRKEMKE